MAPDKERKLSILALAFCNFLAFGLFLFLWWRPSENIESSHALLGAIIFLVLGVASLVLYKIIREDKK